MIKHVIILLLIPLNKNQILFCLVVFNGVICLSIIQPREKEKKTKQILKYKLKKESKNILRNTLKVTKHKSNPFEQFKTERNTGSKLSTVCSVTN